KAIAGGAKCQRYGDFLLPDKIANQKGLIGHYAILTTAGKVNIQAANDRAPWDIGFDAVELHLERSSIAAAAESDVRTVGHRPCLAARLQARAAVKLPEFAAA